MRTPKEHAMLLLLLLLTYSLQITLVVILSFALRSTLVVLAVALQRTLVFAKGVSEIYRGYLCIFITHIR